MHRCVAWAADRKTKIVYECGTCYDVSHSLLTLLSVATPLLQSLPVQIASPTTSQYERTRMHACSVRYIDLCASPRPTGTDTGTRTGTLTLTRTFPGSR